MKRASSLFCFSVEEQQDDAAGGRHADDAEFEQRQRREVRRLRAEPGADHEAEQRLEEEHWREVAAQEVAEAAGRGDGDDDHHAGADSLQERHAEDDHECELDERGGADAERGGEKADEDACDAAVDVEAAPREERLAHGKMTCEPCALVDAQVEERGGEEHHGGGGEGEIARGHDIRDSRAEERAEDAEEADDGARPDDDLVLAEMADRAGERRKDHRGKRDGERFVDGDAEADIEQRDGDACAAGADEADERAKREHGEKDHGKASLRGITGEYFLRDCAALCRGRRVWPGRRGPANGTQGPHAESFPGAVFARAAERPAVSCRRAQGLSDSERKNDKRKAMTAAMACICW